MLPCPLNFAMMDEPSYQGNLFIRKDITVTAEAMWNKSGLKGEYDAWSFGDDADLLAKLVKDGIKTATCSARCFYEMEGEPLPEIGTYSIILDSGDEAVCVIKTTKVYLAPFNRVTAEHAFREGEGDRSLAYWRDTHKRFFTEELEAENLEFSEDLELVCEEFEVVYSE